MDARDTRLRDALGRIEEIRERMVRGSVFRGYRALPVAATGAIAIAAAAAQPALVPEPAAEPAAWARLWLIVATISGALAGGEILLRHVRGGSDLGRARTRLAVGQFLPCVVAGAALTAVLFRAAPEARWMLPGLWSVLFGLGIFSSRPVLPRAFTWLAAGYVAAGFAVLILARGESAFSPLAMGVPFGAGQLAAGVLLYLTLEGGHERG